MDRKYPFDALELNDNLSFDNEIHVVTAVQQDPLVIQWQCNLPLELYRAKPEFMRQAFLVRRLRSGRQAWIFRSRPTRKRGAEPLKFSPPQAAVAYRNHQPLVLRR